MNKVPYIAVEIALAIFSAGVAGWRGERGDFFGLVLMTVGCVVCIRLAIRIATDHRA